MNPLFKLIATIVISMLTEVIMRRNNQGGAADAAEAMALAAATQAGMAAAENIALPVYLAPFRSMLINPVTIGHLAKTVFDASEDHVNKLMDTLQK